MELGHDCKCAPPPLQAAQVPYAVDIIVEATDESVAGVGGAICEKAKELDAAAVSEPRGGGALVGAAGEVVHWSALQGWWCTGRRCREQVGAALQGAGRGGAAGNRSGRRRFTGTCAVTTRPGFAWVHSAVTSRSPEPKPCLLPLLPALLPPTLSGCAGKPHARRPAAVHAWQRGHLRRAALRATGGSAALTRCRALEGHRGAHRYALPVAVARSSTEKYGRCEEAARPTAANL